METPGFDGNQEVKEGKTRSGCTRTQLHNSPEASPTPDFYGTNRGGTYQAEMGETDHQGIQIDGKFWLSKTGQKIRWSTDFVLERNESVLDICHRDWDAVLS